ncbi:MAG: hypothetical protein SAJ72_02690, partial [Jaaginema sp. PMC 1080.18]|nr:hypothetical protein [Jaaginema sp. PMC 1080.18]
ISQQSTVISVLGSRSWAVGSRQSAVGRRVGSYYTGCYRAILATGDYISLYSREVLIKDEE